MPQEKALQHNSGGDLAMGHILVVAQYSWPAMRDLFHMLLHRWFGVVVLCWGGVVLVVWWWRWCGGGGGVVVEVVWCWWCGGHVLPHVLPRVRKKEAFSYPLFAQYVVNIDILEEIMYLASEKVGGYKAQGKYKHWNYYTRGTTNSLISTIGTKTNPGGRAGAGAVPRGRGGGGAPRHQGRQQGREGGLQVTGLVLVLVVIPMLLVLVVVLME